MAMQKLDFIGVLCALLGVCSSNGNALQHAHVLQSSKPVANTQNNIKGHRNFSISGSYNKVVLSTTTDSSREENENNVEELVIRSDFKIPVTLLERPELTKKVEESLARNKGINTVALVGIAGIGGAGKTVLARQFGKFCKYHAVWELNAETKESLAHSFQEFACALAKTTKQKEILASINAIQNKEENERQLLSFIQSRLKKRQSWLLIYDNVENIASICNYFPQDSRVWGNGKVIITTRDSNIGNTEYVAQESVIQIDILSDNEKLVLFTRIFHNKFPQELPSGQKLYLTDFLKNIPSFPLDVSASAYYLKITGTSFEEYLKNLSAADKAVENLKERISQEVGMYAKTRYGIIALHLQNLIKVHEAFGELLLFVSLLDSQNIPGEFLSFFKEDKIVDAFVYHLKKYSLITEEPFFNPFCSNRNFSIHRVIQEITLNYIKQSFTFKKYNKVLESVTKALVKCVQREVADNGIKNYDLFRLKLLTRHADAFLANKSFPNHKDEEDFILMAKFLQNIGIIYRELGDFKKAESFFTRSHLIFKKHYGDHHIETSRTIGNLAVTLGFLGDFLKAQQCFKQVLKGYSNHYGRSHSEAGWFLVHAGNNQRDLGHYVKAKEFYEQSYRIFKKYYGEDHFNIAWCLGNLGDVNRRLGYYEEAKKFLEKSANIYEKHHNKNKLKPAWAFILLGKAYKDFGFYEKAADLFEKSLTIYKQYYGENNIRTAEVIMYLGSVYTNLGQYQKAKPLLDQSFLIFQRHYGDNHVASARALQEIANYDVSMGNIEKAEKAFKKVLDLFQQLKDPEIYITFEALANLCLIKYKNTKALKTADTFKNEAIGYLTQALQVIEAKFPKDSWHSQKIRIKLNQLT